MIKPPYHGNGLLTGSVFALLCTMSDCGADEDDYLSEDVEAVREGRLVWVGIKTFATSTLDKALRLCAVRDVTEGTGSLERYVLNEVGRAIVNDPAQADKVVMLLAMGRNMTVTDGKVVELLG